MADIGGQPLRQGVKVLCVVIGVQRVGCPFFNFLPDLDIVE